MVELLEEESLNSQDTLNKVKPIIGLTSVAFDQLLQLGLDLNHLYILEGLQEEAGQSLHITSAKLLGWRQTLERKGYIDIKGSITEDGKKLLLEIGTGSTVTLKRIKRQRREVIMTSFDSWWMAYPATDTFEYKGKAFRGTRALRTSKLECTIKFGAIISQGEYTVEEMIAALEEEKKYKMIDSLNTGKNKMSYFQNSATYLNQRTFESWIELIRAPQIDHKIIENSAPKRVDI